MSYKIIIFSLIFALLASCNAVKRVEDSDYLLSKNTIYVNDKKTKNLELYSYLKQRPNQKVGNLPILLYLYNWSNPNFEQDFETWVKNHPKKSKFYSKKFSNKQTKSIYKFSKGLNNWIKKRGEKPIILSNKKTKQSVQSLKKYFENKGYFDVKINKEDVVTKKKTKKVNYHIKTNKPYYLDSVSSTIETPVIDSLYQLTKMNSFLREKSPFDMDNFIKEQNRLTKYYRNNGIFQFNKDHIRFDVDLLDTTTYYKNATVLIKNPLVKVGNDYIKKPFKIQKVKNIKVYTDYSYNTKDKPYLDSIYYKGYTFYAHKKLKVNPKYLANALSITPNGIYKDSERNLTRKYLNDLKIYRSPIGINYIEKEDTDLDTEILLTPLKKFGFGADVEATHSNIKPFGLLGKFSFYDRNVFKGLETFEFALQMSFLNIAEDASNSDFNYFGFTAYEIGANTTFKIPRIFFPINTTKLIPKSMRPSTEIKLSTSLQKNIGLDRQNITGNIAYSWKSNSKSKHQFELLNVQYINNLNSNSYFNIFRSEYNKLQVVGETIVDSNSMDSDGNITAPLNYINYVLDPINGFETTNNEDFLSVQRVNERRNIIKEDILVPTLTYNYTYNNKSNINDYHFSFFNARFVSAGNITSALTNKNADTSKKEIFGLPIAQYIKAEIEYKKYWDLGLSNHLVYRTFIGAAIPYGNSDEIPFSRRYRAGGSNDIRAWKTFDLGPGSSNSSLEFNTGNFKIITNFEYRFKMLNNFYSALFIDAGNVWDISNSDLTAENAKFNGFNSLKDIAIGTGTGIRYDFSFLIFRMDLGFKTYEPYLETNKWMRNYNFKNAVYNFGINYPF